MNDNISKLYGALKSKGYTDIGKDEDAFRDWIGKEGNVKILYGALSKNGYDDIGDEAQFTEWVGVKPPQDMTNQETSSYQPTPEEVQQYTLQNKPDIFKPKTGSLVDRAAGIEAQEQPTFEVPNVLRGITTKETVEDLNNTVANAYSTANQMGERMNARVDMLSKNIQDPEYLKSRNELELRVLASEIDGLLDKEHGRLKSKAPIGQNAFNAIMGSRQYNQSNKSTQKNISNLDSAKRLIEQSQYIVDAAKRGDTGILSDTWQGFKDSLEAEDFTFGLADAASSAAILDAIKKVEKGEQLTESEDKLLRASAINMAVQYYFANDIGQAYKMGQVSAESVPFMLEMAINPISSFGKASAKTLLNYGLKAYAKQVGKGLAKGAVAGTGMALTTGLGRVASGTTDRLSQGYNYGVDFDGNLFAEKKKDAMGVGEAFARSLASTAIENQSEMIFNAFKGMGGFMKGVEKVLPGGVNKFFDMLSHNKVADAYRWLKNSPVFRNYLVKDVRNATQIGGIFEEYAEEVYNNLANFAIGEMSWEDVVSLDKNIDTFLGLAPTQVMFGILGLGGAASMRYQTRKTLEDLKATMNEQQRKELEGLLDMGIDAKEVDVRGFIRGVMENQNYTIENKRDLIKAAYYVAQQRSIDELTEADVIDKVNAENQFIDSMTDPSTGNYAELSRNVINPQTGESEQQKGYVVGWIGEGEKRQPIFVADGMDNNYANRVVLKPTEWSMDSYREMPAEQVKAVNEEMNREEAARQAEREAKYAPEVLNAQMQQGVPFDTPTSQIVPVAPMPEGNGWIVEEYALDTNNKVAKAPIVRELTNDEYRDMLQAQIDAQEAAAPVNAPSGENVGEDVNAEVNAPVNNENVQPVAEGSATEQQVAQPQAPIIPTKEDGSIDFVSYGKEGTFKTLGEKYGEKMPNKVAITAKALAEDVKKAQKMLNKAEEAYDNAPIGREQKAEEVRDKAKAELEAIQREANFWAEMDAEIKEAQAVRESMLNPQAEVNTSSEPLTADEFVAQQLASGNIVLNKEDYKRETGYGDEEVEAMNGGSKKLLTGDGMTIQEAGERLMEMDRENGTNFFDQSDPNAGRDELLSVLGSVKTRKELNQYVASNRAEQAKRDSEGLYNELERQVMDAHYASLEDYVLQMEASEMENPFRDIDVAQIDVIFAEVEEEYQNYINNEQGTTSEIAEGSDNVLSEEQADNTGGTSGVESEGDSERNGERTSEESERAYAATEELKQEEGETTLQFAERAAEENDRREPLRNRAREWAVKLSVTVNLIESVHDVYNLDALAAIQSGQRVTGWFEESTGEVCFYMPFLESESDVDATFIHEVVAHKGLRGLLGEKFDAFCDEVWDVMSNADRLKLMAYPGVSHLEGKKKSRAAADEYIAHLAENVDVTESAWSKLTELIKRFLKALGLEPKMTNADIANTIKKSYQRLLEGEGGASVVGEGTRFNAKKTSDRRQDINRINSTVDQALSLVTGKDIKDVKAERVKKAQKRKEDAAEIYQSVLSGDFNDVTLQEINDYIDDATPLHPYGRRISQRLPQKLERSLHEGSRTNAVDALFSRIHEKAVPASRRTSEAGRREIEERKKEALKGWAIATNNWHTDLSEFTDEQIPIGEGTDSKVYASKDGKYVIKTSFGKPEGKRFRPDIDNIPLFNSVFRNSAYEIVGYGEFDGKFARILKQPFVEFAEDSKVSVDERVDYMRTLGFEPINEAKTAFSNGTIIVADLQKSNIVKTAQGNIRVIDADVKLHTKDVGGSYTYPPVEADLPEGNTRFRFIGENGARNLDKAEEATTRLDNLAVAREMESAEKDAKTIKMATGWERGADELWRYEVDDNIDFELRRPKKVELKKAYDEANEKYYKLEMRVPVRTPKNATEEERQRIKDMRKELAKLRKAMNKAFDAYYDYSAESATLGEFLGKDNQLFKEYPELAGYDVSFLRDSKKLAEGLKGSFTPEYKVIWVDDARPKGDIKSTLVHEIQHAIQGIEGFAQGGTPAAFASAKYQAEEWKANFNKFINRYGFEDWSKNLPTEDWMKYGKEYKGQFGGLHRAFIDNAVEDEDVKKTLTKELDYVKSAYDKFYQIAGGMDPAYKFKDANEWYRSLSGEVESRNVQQRMGMTDEQRRSTLASETEDVAREDQIFLQNAMEEGQTMFRVVKDPAVDYISQAEDVVEVPRDEVMYTMNNIANQLYKVSGRFMRELYKYGTIGRVLKGEYAEIDQIKAKKEYDHAKPIFDEYLNELVWMKYQSTEAAQEVINDVISDVEYAMQYYKDLALGKDVWRTKNSPRFRISEKHRKDVSKAIADFTYSYNSKPVSYITNDMTDEQVDDLLEGYLDSEDVQRMKNEGAHGFYLRKTDRIYIFVDDIPLESVENSMFHENLHLLLGANNPLTSVLWDKVKDEPNKFIEVLKNSYRSDEWAEEYFVYHMAKGLSEGELEKFISNFEESDKESLFNILNTLGYEYESESRERLGQRRRIRATSNSLQQGGKSGERRSGESREALARKAEERKERLQQLFGRVADMGLDGVLGNKEYVNAMVDMYKVLPEAVQREVADEALSRYGGDVAPAVSDWLNHKAEASVWDKVVAVIREALRNVGFDLDLNTNESKYILWRSQKPINRNNLLEMAEDIDMRYRLKVGEYSTNDDGTTPDGGGTRFSVRSKPKTKAELKEEVRDLKEDVKGLKDEVKDLKKQVNTLRSGNKDEWEEKQRAIVSFIKGRLTKEAGSVLGKTRLDQLLTLVNKASTATDLHKPLQFIEQVINDASIEYAAAKMDKLIKTKLQGETNRGVAKGVVVDETTRRLFDSIRGTFKDLITTSIDSELRYVRGEILRFGREINDLPKDDIQGRAILTAKQDAMKERRKELEKEQEEIQRKNIAETKESLERRHDELVEAMDAHIEGKGIWTQEMRDEYDSIPLRMKLAEIRESQAQLDAIMADAIMTRREAYKNTGEARKKLLAEADIIESNYTIAQEELMRLMNEVSSELSAIINEGKSRLATRREALAERRRAIVTMGISAVKDKKIQDPNAILSKKEKFEKWFDNSWMKSVSDFMTAPLNSFNFMLKYIDRNHTIGEGELYNHFMKSKEGALEANNQLYDGLKAYNTAIEEKAKEIFGKSIEKVMKESGKEYIGKVHKQYMYDSSSHKEGEMYPISITKGQAFYVWLTWRQDDGRAKLVADGWNDQSIEEIEDLIGEDYMKFGEWVTDEFFPMLRDEKYNKTHIDMFGTSMAKREHYFPFKVQQGDIQEKGEMGESYSGMPSTITGNIIKRTINKSRIKTDQNAFDMLYKYGNDMETWNAMAKLRQDLNFLHSSKAFRNYLEANSKGLFDKFMKAAEVAVKAYNNSEKDAINDFFAKLNRTWAGTNIGFRLNTAMKQILSYPAFMAYSGNLKYQGYLMKYMLNWVGNYKWAKENLPAFRNRVESGDMGMTGMTDPSFDLGKVINKFGEWGMIPNQLVDALTCAAGARSVYDFEYNRAIKAGMLEEEAKNIAQYNAEVAFNETQQSSRDEFVSPTQVSRNVLIKSMMNYQNSNVGYQRMGNEGLLEIMRAKHVYEQDIKNGMNENEAKKKVANSVIRGTRKMMIAFTILPGLWYLGGRGIVGITAPLISSLFGGDDDDEPYLDDEAKKGLMLSMALGTVAGTSGGQAIASVVQGREYEPMAYVKEFTKIITDAIDNGFNLNTTKNIALKLAKFGGVNVETFENIYLGVEHAIRTGNFDLVDFMFLINLPPSQRKAMAEELYSNMPFMEYAEKVARAQKLFDDYRKNLPYAKGDKNGSKKNAIKKQYVIENLDDDKQDKLEKEKEFKKLQREYNSAEDKDEWLEDHPEYKELETNFKRQEVTKEVNRKTKELK